MSRHSYLHRSVPINDVNLGLQLPRISRLSINSPTTAVNVNRLPPLSSCLQIRAKLQEEAERMIRAECEALKAVAVWDNYGTFSREDISTMISAHDIKRIRGKERKSGFWSLKTFFWIITVWTRLKRFQSLDLIWSSDEKDVVLNYGEKGGIRVHDFCTVVCNRWLTDDLLNFLFQSMNGETTAHYFQVMSEPLMLSQSLRERFFDVLGRKLLSGNLEYIHFALNVKKCEKTEVVTVSSRGNHWTYFVFSVSLNEMYYGDSLG